MALLVLEDITFTGNLPQTTHILHKFEPWISP